MLSHFIFERHFGDIFEENGQICNALLVLCNALLILCNALLCIYKSIEVRGDWIMTAEKKEMQSVTIRIPKTLYAEYKKTLLTQGKIVTYDVRNYMAEVVEKQTKGQKQA